MNYSAHQPEHFELKCHISQRKETETFFFKEMMLSLNEVLQTLKLFINFYAWWKADQTST